MILFLYIFCFLLCLGFIYKVFIDCLSVVFLWFFVFLFFILFVRWEIFSYFFVDCFVMFCVLDLLLRFVLLWDWERGRGVMFFWGICWRFCFWVRIGCLWVIWNLCGLCLVWFCFLFLMMDLVEWCEWWMLYFYLIMLSDY